MHRRHVNGDFSMGGSFRSLSGGYLGNLSIVNLTLIMSSISKLSLLKVIKRLKQVFHLITPN